MFGLGKSRTRLGKYIDGQKELSQEWLSKNTGINRDVISRLCDGEKEVEPRVATRQKIISALRRNGYDVTAADFWPQ